MAGHETRFRCTITENGHPCAMVSSYLTIQEHVMCKHMTRQERACVADWQCTCGAMFLSKAFVNKHRHDNPLLDGRHVITRHFVEWDINSPIPPAIHAATEKLFRLCKACEVVLPEGQRQPTIQDQTQLILQTMDIFARGQAFGHGQGFGQARAHGFGGPTGPAGHMGPHPLPHPQPAFGGHQMQHNGMNGSRPASRMSLHNQMEQQVADNGHFIHNSPHPPVQHPAEMHHEAPLHHEAPMHFEQPAVAHRPPPAGVRSRMDGLLQTINAPGQRSTNVHPRRNLSPIRFAVDHAPRRVHESSYSPRTPCFSPPRTPAQNSNSPDPRPVAHQGFNPHGVPPLEGVYHPYPIPGASQLPPVPPLPPLPQGVAGRSRSRNGRGDQHQGGDDQQPIPLLQIRFGESPGRPGSPRSFDHTSSNGRDMRNHYAVRGGRYCGEQPPPMTENIGTHSLGEIGQNFHEEREMGRFSPPPANRTPGNRTPSKADRDRQLAQERERSRSGRRVRRPSISPWRRPDASNGGQRSRGRGQNGPRVLDQTDNQPAWRNQSPGRESNQSGDPEQARNRGRDMTRGRDRFANERQGRQRENGESQGNNSTGGAPWRRKDRNGGRQDGGNAPWRRGNQQGQGADSASWKRRSTSRDRQGSRAGNGTPAWRQRSNSRTRQGDQAGNGTPAWRQRSKSPTRQGDQAGNGTPAWTQRSNSRGGQGDRQEGQPPSRQVGQKNCDSQPRNELEPSTWGRGSGSQRGKWYKGGRGANNGAFQGRGRSTGRREEGQAHEFPPWRRNQNDQQGEAQNNTGTTDSTATTESTTGWRRRTPSPVRENAATEEQNAGPTERVPTPPSTTASIQNSGQATPTRESSQTEEMPEIQILRTRSETEIPKVRTSSEGRKTRSLLKVPKRECGESGNAEDAFETTPTAQAELDDLRTPSPPPADYFGKKKRIPSLILNLSSTMPLSAAPPKKAMPAPATVAAQEANDATASAEVVVRRRMRRTRKQDAPENDQAAQGPTIPAGTPDVIEIDVISIDDEEQEISVETGTSEALQRAKFPPITLYPPVVGSAEALSAPAPNGDEKPFPLTQESPGMITRARRKRAGGSVVTAHNTPTAPIVTIEDTDPAPVGTQNNSTVEKEPKPVPESSMVTRSRTASSSQTTATTSETATSKTTTTTPPKTTATTPPKNTEKAPTRKRGRPKRKRERSYSKSDRSSDSGADTTSERDRPQQGSSTESPRKWPRFF